MSPQSGSFGLQVRQRRRNSVGELNAVAVAVPLATRGGHQNEDAFNEAPQRSNTEGEDCQNQLNDSAGGATKVKVVDAKTSKEDAQDTGDNFRLLLVARRNGW